MKAREHDFGAEIDRSVLRSEQHTSKAREGDVTEFAPRGNSTDSDETESNRPICRVDGRVTRQLERCKFEGSCLVLALNHLVEAARFVEGRSRSKGKCRHRAVHGASMIDDTVISYAIGGNRWMRYNGCPVVNDIRNGRPNYRWTDLRRGRRRWRSRCSLGEDVDGYRRGGCGGRVRRSIQGLLLLIDHLQNQVRVRKRRKIGDQERSLVKLADIELDGLTNMAFRRRHHHFSGMNRHTARGISFWTQLARAFENQKLARRAGMKFQNRSPARHTSGKSWRGELNGRGVLRYFHKYGTAPEVQFSGAFIETEDRVRAQARDGQISE